MQDWNDNGKFDSFDSFVEHEVFHEVNGDESSGSHLGLLWLIPVLLLLLRILLR